MSNEIASSHARRPCGERRADHARRRAREQREGGMRRRLGDRRDAARRAHDQRLGQPLLGAAIRERLQVAGERRAEIGVDRGRRGALVLAELGRDLVRGDDARSGQPPPQLVGHGRFVPRVAEREEQAHGDRLRIDLRQRLEIERPQNALRPDPLVDAEAALERHERLRMVVAEPVEMSARLPTQVEQVLEPGGRDERRLRALALEERVRRDGRPVREALQVARADGSSGREHRLLLARRGRHLGRRDAAILDEDGVRERAADVDAENAHGANVRGRRCVETGDGGTEDGDRAPRRRAASPSTSAGRSRRTASPTCRRTGSTRRPGRSR